MFFNELKLYFIKELKSCFIEELKLCFTKIIGGKNEYHYSHFNI
jgi:hypothetical protein